jgi:hypothetical protein
LDRIDFDWGGDEEDDHSEDDESSSRSGKHIGRSIKVSRRQDQPVESSSDEDEEAEDEASPRRKKSTGDDRKEQMWMERYSQLKEFYRVHGRGAVIPCDSEKLTTLNYWARYQKSARGTMSKERKRLLDRIGFEWAPQTGSGSGIKKTVAFSSKLSSRDEEEELSDECEGESDEESVRTTLSNYKLPPGKRSEMERYLGVIEAQIRDKEEEVNELKSTCTEISRLLKKVEPTI